MKKYFYFKIWLKFVKLDVFMNNLALASILSLSFSLNLNEKKYNEFFNWRYLYIYIY